MRRNKDKNEMFSLFSYWLVSSENVLTGDFDFMLLFVTYKKRTSQNSFQLMFMLITSEQPKPLVIKYLLK